MNQLYLTRFGAVSKPILTFDNTYGRTSGYKPWHQHSCIQELCIEMLYVVSQIVAGMAFQATSGSWLVAMMDDGCEEEIAESQDPWRTPQANPDDVSALAVHVDDDNVVYLFQKSWSLEQSDPLMLRLVTLVDYVTMMMMLTEEQPQEHNNVAFLQSGVLHLNANQPLCLQLFL